VASAAFEAACARPKIGVSVVPGSTRLTGMFQAASSRRSAVDSASRAALLAEIGASRGIGTRAVGAVTLMIRPCPARTNGRKAWVT